MIMKGFDDWVIIISAIGLFLSFLSSAIVMISLIKLPFKDISTELRKFSTINDIAMTLTFIFRYFTTNSISMCFENFSFLFYVILHAFWILYMCLIMHRLIYSRKLQKTTQVKYYYLLLTIIAGGLSALIFINNKNDPCLLTYDTFAFYYIIFTLCLPHTIIFIIIALCYWDIRKVLITEIMKCERVFIQKREFFKRIYGYPFIFLIFGVNSFFYLIEIQYRRTSQTFQAIRMLITSFYPCINSIFYGLTQSSRRVLKSLLTKHSEYKTEENILNELRQEEYILPRFYLDLLDEPESQIFS